MLQKKSIDSLSAYTAYDNISIQTPDPWFDSDWILYLIRIYFGLMIISLCEIVTDNMDSPCMKAI